MLNEYFILYYIYIYKWYIQHTEKFTSMQDLKFHLILKQNSLFNYLSFIFLDSIYLLLCGLYRTSIKYSKLPLIISSHLPILIPTYAINNIAKVLSLHIHESFKSALLLLELELRASQNK